MAKKTIGDINGWVFIGIGFVVIAISIFFYDTLKIFIAIGGIMTLYGMAKISYDQFKAKMFPKEEEEAPIDLDKAENPYIKQEKAKQAAYQQQLQQQRTQHAQMQRQQHPTNNQSQQRQATHPIQHQTPHQQHPQQKQAIQQQQRHPAQQQARGKYCHNCGTVIHAHHRFCNACGARVS